MDLYLKILYSKYKFLFYGNNKNNYGFVKYEVNDLEFKIEQLVNIAYLTNKNEFTSYGHFVGIVNELNIGGIRLKENDKIEKYNQQELFSIVINKVIARKLTVEDMNNISKIVMCAPFVARFEKSPKNLNYNIFYKYLSEKSLKQAMKNTNKIIQNLQM